jgi:kinetochore protein NDC80
MIPRIGGGRENQVPPSPARSVASTAAASSRRQSVGSTAASTSTASRRRQSLVPHAYTNPTLRDPRNLSDKAWQQACAKKVGQFLQQGGYDHPLTPKTLRSPSAKDFGLMVTFLLRQVDPTFGQGNGMKLEDEVVLNFRALGYPFGVSKTSLVAAGSPHTWPTLLAALAWLVDQLTLLHQAQETRPFLEAMDQTLQFESLQDLQQQTEQAFFGYLGECYTAFMQNDASQTEALQAALAERFAVDDAYLEQEINRIQDLNANIAVRMEDLQNASAE